MEPEHVKISLIMCIFGLATGVAYMFWTFYYFVAYKDTSMLGRPDAPIIIFLTVVLSNAVSVIYKVYKSGQS